ncbi:MAG: hypothetical protein ABI613_03065 [Gemmatimonadota bacterium]
MNTGWRVAAESTSGSLPVATSWQLLIDRERSGAENMARDQALLDLAEQLGAVVLRVYQWYPHCISFGRNEPALARYHRDLIDSLGLDCVRRPTGGRAVWHARELTYAVAAPLRLFGTLALAYHSIHSMLASAIESFGGAASLATRPARQATLDAGACFASPAGGEVVMGGRKVVGSAQLRQGSAFLQHGSLLIEDGQDVIARVTRGAPPPSLDTTLAVMLGRSIGFAEVSTAVTEAAAAWRGPWEHWSHEPELQKREDEHLARFQSAEWTWRR